MIKERGAWTNIKQDIIQNVRPHDEQSIEDIDIETWPNLMRGITKKETMKKYKQSLVIPEREGSALDHDHEITKTTKSNEDT